MENTRQWITIYYRFAFIQLLQQPIFIDSLTLKILLPLVHRRKIVQSMLMRIILCFFLKTNQQKMDYSIRMVFENEAQNAPEGCTQLSVGDMPWPIELTGICYWDICGTLWLGLWGCSPWEGVNGEPEHIWFSWLVRRVFLPFYSYG